MLTYGQRGVCGVCALRYPATWARPVRHRFGAGARALTEPGTAACAVAAYAPSRIYSQCRTSRERRTGRKDSLILPQPFGSVPAAALRGSTDVDILVRAEWMVAPPELARIGKLRPVLCNDRVTT